MSSVEIKLKDYGFGEAQTRHQNAMADERAAGADMSIAMWLVWNELSPKPTFTISGSRGEEIFEGVVLPSGQANDDGVVNGLVYLGGTLYHLPPGPELDRETASGTLDRIPTRLFNGKTPVLQSAFTEEAPRVFRVIRAEQERRARSTQ